MAELLILEQETAIDTVAVEQLLPAEGPEKLSEEVEAFLSLVADIDESLPEQEKKEIDLTPMAKDQGVAEDDKYYKK